MEELIGVWTRADWRRIDGRAAQFGASVDGRLCYERGGFVSAFLMRTDWGATGPAGGPGFMGYAGRWRVEGAEVRHAIDFASIPEWVGTTLVREWSFTPEGILLLLTPWREGSRGRTRDRLSWRRSDAP